VQNRCSNHHGTITGPDVFGGTFDFKSANSHVPAEGKGYANFYREENCVGAGAQITLGQNQFTEAYMIKTSENIFKLACFCCGSRGPCKCDGGLKAPKDDDAKEALVRGGCGYSECARSLTEDKTEL